jgi:hypothetical protein
VISQKRLEIAVAAQRTRKLHCFIKRDLIQPRRRHTRVKFKLKGAPRNVLHASLRTQTPQQIDELQMWPFKPTPIVDADTAAWHVDNFAWLAASFGGNGALAATTLVLPKPGFFPSDGEQGHDKALRIFERVKHYCGMGNWPVDLVPDHNPAAIPSSPMSLSAPVHGKHAQGTFSVAGGAVQISYAPSLLANPERMIATFAHELAHYLLATAPTSPPCEDDEHEFLTDLTAVYLGFGVCMANSVFDFQPLQDGLMQGWRMGRSGYLPEQDLVFATALFIAAKDLDPTPACQCLKPHLAALLKRGLRDLTSDRRFVNRIRESIP